jgi:BlaI family transcriptional regulator, penicillinase repressor
MRRKNLKPLSSLEHLVMSVIWERESATGEEVRTALAARHPMKESTARTILTRLEEKGYLNRRVDGRTNVYSGVDAPESVAAGAVRQIIDRLCGGSVEQLLIGMVDDEVLSERELQRLAQKIAKRNA